MTSRLNIYSTDAADDQSGGIPWEGSRCGYCRRVAGYLSNFDKHVTHVCYSCLLPSQGSQIFELNLKIVDACPSLVTYITG